MQEKSYKRIPKTFRFFYLWQETSGLPHLGKVQMKGKPCPCQRTRKYILLLRIGKGWENKGCTQTHTNLIFFTDDLQVLSGGKSLINSSYSDFNVFACLNWDIFSIHNKYFSLAKPGSYKIHLVLFIKFLWLPIIPHQKIYPMTKHTNDFRDGFESLFSPVIF
jgi:hypothetical protein